VLSNTAKAVRKGLCVRMPAELQTYNMGRLAAAGDKSLGWHGIPELYGPSVKGAGRTRPCCSPRAAGYPLEKAKMLDSIALSMVK
jgi:hypothetical protein